MIQFSIKDKTEKTETLHLIYDKQLVTLLELVRLSLLPTQSVVIDHTSCICQVFIVLLFNQ